MAFYCGVQTQPVRYVDPAPAEYCDVEVEHLGDLCPAHAEADDEDARAEAAREQAWEDSRWD